MISASSMAATGLVSIPWSAVSFSGGLSRWCTGVTHVLSMIRVATLATLMLEAGQCLELLWVKPILPQFLEGEHLLYESLE